MKDYQHAPDADPTAKGKLPETSPEFTDGKDEHPSFHEDRHGRPILSILNMFVWFRAISFL